MPRGSAGRGIPFKCPDLGPGVPGRVLVERVEGEGPVGRGAELGAAAPHRVIALLLLDAIVGETWDKIVRIARRFPPALAFTGISLAIDSISTVPVFRDPLQAAKLVRLVLPTGTALGQCCGTDAVRSARRVCDHLGVPHYTWDFREVFEREVVAPFAAEYASGRTPNPLSSR